MVAFENRNSRKVVSRSPLRETGLYCELSDLSDTQDSIRNVFNNTKYDLAAPELIEFSNSFYSRTRLNFQLSK